MDVLENIFSGETGFPNLHFLTNKLSFFLFILLFKSGVCVSVSSLNLFSQGHDFSLAFSFSLLGFRNRISDSRDI